MYVKQKYNLHVITDSDLFPSKANNNYETPNCHKIERTNSGDNTTLINKETKQTISGGNNFVSANCVPLPCFKYIK